MTKVRKKLEKTQVLGAESRLDRAHARGQRDQTDPEARPDGVDLRGRDRHGYPRGQTHVAAVPRPARS